MRSSRREIQTGFFVLLGIVAVVTALLMLTDPGTFRGRINATTSLKDAGGLRKGDPVMMRGVPIGRVREFTMQPAGVLVNLEMEKDYPVPADSRVELVTGGLFGGGTVNIIPGRAQQVLRDGGFLPAAVGGGGLFDVAASAGAKADTVLSRAQQILNPQTVESVGASAVELRTMLGDLSALARDQRQQISTLSASLQRSAAGVERAATRPELERAVARTDSISRQLGRATTSLERSSTSLETIIGRLERGEGTLGKLSRDEALYNNMNGAAVSARALIEDMQKDPKKYFSVRVF